MDQYTKGLALVQLHKVKEALHKNNMDAIVVDCKEDVINVVKSLIKDGSKVSVGGSQSLFECGIIDALRTMPVAFDDRYAPNLTRDEMEAIYRRAFDCDVYLCSSNAVTMQGELCNVDGNANRVAALSYGPKQVILIVGSNKITHDLETAEKRIESIAAPANCMRLSLNNVCTHVGHCMDCESESRICCTYVVHKRQRVKNRICVILVPEEIGY